jgi:hypothetical protein
MEPLFVDNDFGRGFDSRRLHHFSFNNLEIYGPHIVRCRKMLAWRFTSIAGTVGTARPVMPKILSTVNSMNARKAGSAANVP